jgi:hypothetical protein
MFERLLEISIRQRDFSSQEMLEKQLLLRLKMKTASLAHALDFGERNLMEVFLGKAYYQTTLEICKDSVPANCYDFPSMKFPSDLPSKHVSRIVSGLFSLLLVSRKVSARSPNIQENISAYEQANPEYLIMTFPLGHLSEQLDIINSRSFTKIKWAVDDPSNKHEQTKKHFTENLHRYFLDTLALPI